MLLPHRAHVVLAIALALSIIAGYALLGTPKPPEQWKLIDIAGEASIALMACAWFAVVLSSRPPGRVTALLGWGLAGLMLGALADCLDEFFAVAKGMQWNHLLESGITLAGMVCLTWGLVGWRREQFMVSEHLQKRERLFRDHRSFDSLTQVADADYLREQLRIEYEQRAGDACLLMLDIDNFHLINRTYGQREGDRVLQAVTQVLLLNLRSTDLLCRYAGDRFAVLLPATAPDAANALADHLRRAVSSLRHHPQRATVPPMAIVPTIRYSYRNLDTDPRRLLKELNRALERRMPLDTPDGAFAPAATVTA